MARLLVTLEDRTVAKLDALAHAASIPVRAMLTLIINERHALASPPDAPVRVTRASRKAQADWDAGLEALMAASDAEAARLRAAGSES